MFNHKTQSPRTEFSNKLRSIKVCSHDDIKSFVEQAERAHKIGESNQIFDELYTYIRCAPSNTTILGLYVVDAILTQSRDFYIRIIGPHLSDIVDLAYRRCPLEHKTKVLKVLSLWKQKQIITENHYTTIYTRIDSLGFKRVKETQNKAIVKKDPIEELEEVELLASRKINTVKEEEYSKTKNNILKLVPVHSYDIYIPENFSKSAPELAKINGTKGIIPIRDKDGKLIMVDFTLRKCMTCSMGFKNEKKLKTHVDNHAQEKTEDILRRQYYNVKILNKYKNNNTDQIVESKIKPYIKSVTYVDGMKCYICEGALEKYFDKKFASWIAKDCIKIDSVSFTEMLPNKTVEPLEVFLHVECIRNKLKADINN